MKRNKEKFIEQTSKDYNLPFEDVLNVYNIYYPNYNLIYKKLEELIQKKIK